MARPVLSLQSKTRSPVLQVVKTSIAAIASWLACNLLLGQPVPIFATIAALLVVQPSVNQSLAKGLERSIGVVLGVTLAYTAHELLGDATWVVLGVIVVSLLLAWVLRLTPGSANQIPISAMLVVALGGGTLHYAGERVIETVIGAVIGLVVNVIIVPPVLAGPAHAAVTRLADGIAASLDELTANLRSVSDAAALRSMLVRVRTLRALQAEAAAAVSTAEDSLMLNPLGTRHRTALERDREYLASLSVLVTRVVGMTRAVHDHYDDALASDPTVGAITVELDRASHDVRLSARNLTRPLHDDAEPVTAELPALTAPLVIAKPHPDHWILVGSLMEDLRRVREVLAGLAD
ncbi:hypothetical protein GCM10022239_17190 [Leifsonia bigeumensis]|uniref:Integral membrane bound transporter domain-containing protein n=1 Tax=Leifsonella bigeumensis TaxID=433643 RepID=A0ABP7FMY6_9MICO